MNVSWSLLSLILLQIEQEEEEKSRIAFLIVFLLTAAFFGSIILYYYLKYGNDFVQRQSLYLHKLNPAYRVTLQKYFPYYQRLDARNKDLFERRVQKFIHLKDFIPRGLTEVTDEMKTLIAASAIEITFGLPRIYFSHFKKILVYPDDYYSRITRLYHQGEVNLNGGMIVLSWKNFAHGYIERHDGRNLGLHEMAHALRLENGILNNEYGFLDDGDLKEWTRLSYEEIDLMSEGKSHFFRDYGATNSQEFFAVAVEIFFERPEEFKRQKPELYKVLTQLLNQDPAKA